MFVQPYEVVPLLLLILLSFGIIAYYVRIKHRERMEIIKKGEGTFNGNDLDHLKHSILSKAILLIALAIGLLVAASIKNFVGLPTLLVYAISLLLFGGLGLLVYYFTIRKSE